MMAVFSLRRHRVDRSAPTYSTGMIAVLNWADLNIVDSGAVGISSLQFVLVTAVDGIN